MYDANEKEKENKVKRGYDILSSISYKMPCVIFRISFHFLLRPLECDSLKWWIVTGEDKGKDNRKDIGRSLNEILK